MSALDDPNSFVPDIAPDAWNKIRFDANGKKLAESWEFLRGLALRGSYKRDLGDDLTEAKIALLQRVVVLQIWCEVADSRFNEMGGLPDDYTKNSTTLLRLLKELGLEQKAKSSKNDLASYLAGKVGNDVAAATMPSWLAGKAI